MTELRIPADHPAFEGHFPGRPIVPAVVLLAEVLAAIAAATARPAHEWAIANAKFLMPVAPGTPLTLAHESNGAGERFEIRCDDGVVATGLLTRA